MTVVSSEQIRKWFHEGVVLNHADRDKPGYHPHCDHRQPKVAFPNEFDGFYNEPVHPLAVEAFQAYADIMVAMGVRMSGAGGVNSCRNIGTSNTPSLHAYLCAVDLPPNTYKPTAFLVAIENIRTNSGAQVFRNLSGDRMHDQLNCSPTALSSGIEQPTKEDDMAFLTETQQKELAKFLDHIDAENSNVSFVIQSIGDIRERNRVGPYAPLHHLHAGGSDLTEDDVKTLINDSQIVAPI